MSHKPRNTRQERWQDLTAEKATCPLRRRTGALAHSGEEIDRGSARFARAIRPRGKYPHGLADICWPGILILMRAKGRTRTKVWYVFSASNRSRPRSRPSSSVVGGTSVTPTACLLRSFIHSGKPPPQPRTKDETSELVCQIFF